MNRIAKWMLLLYPASWRARYGDELQVLLADSGADARTVADLFRRGLQMRFSTGSFLKLAVVLGSAGLFLGAGIAFLLPSQYTSRATLEISSAQTMNLNERIQQMELQVLSRTVLSRIINDPGLQLYSDERMTRPLEDVIEQMRGSIRIDFMALRDKRAAAFNIVFTYPDRVKAQRVVAALIEQFRRQAQEQPVFDPRKNPASLLEVLDAASLPSTPFYPRRSVVMLGGFLAGVFLAGLVRVVRRTGFVARRFALIAIVLGVAGLAAVAVADRLDVLPYRYRSIATMRLRGGNTAQVTGLTTDVLSRTSLSTVIADPRLHLYGEQLRTLPLEDVIETMKQHLSVRTYATTEGPVFSVAFDYPDRYKAQMTVSAIMNYFEEANLRLYPSASSTPPIQTSSVLTILDPPSLPVQPSAPNRFLMAISGCCCGLVVAVVIATIRQRWKPETNVPLDAVSG